MDEREHCGVELCGPLQWSKMAHAIEKGQFCVWDTSGEMLGVFVFDELIMFALYDDDRHADLGQIIDGIVGLRSLHEADSFGEFLEFVGCGR